jgi:STE24 endopeptidase
MQFTFMLAVLAALVISQYCPQAPVPGAGYRVLLAGAAMATSSTVLVVSSVLSAVQSRQRSAGQSLNVRRLRMLQAMLWLAAAFGILYGLSWPQIVRFNWRLDRVMLLDDLLILLPVLLPLLPLWGGHFEMDRAARRAKGETDCATSLTRAKYFNVHLRHYFGILLTPVMALLAYQDAVALLAPGLLDGSLAMLAYVPALTLLVCFFPILLRHVWATFPLPQGPLRDRLEQCGMAAGFRAREILVWRTGGLAVNAAVSGFLPPWRYVYLSDGLLTEMTDDEVVAVFAHEVGHVRHRHLPLRIAAMFVPVSLWLLLGQLFPATLQAAYGWLDGGDPQMRLAMGLVLLGFVGLYVFAVFGSYSKLLEAHADLCACRASGDADGRNRPDLMTSALEKLARVGSADRNTSGWQHDSIARRIEFVHRATDDPQFECRFLRRVRLASSGIVFLVLSPLIFWMVAGR